MSAPNRQVNSHEIDSLKDKIRTIESKHERQGDSIKAMADAVQRVSEKMEVLVRVQTEFVTRSDYTTKEIADLRKLVEDHIKETETVKLENVSIRSNLTLLKWLLSGVSVVGLAMFTALLAWIKPS